MKMGKPKLVRLEVFKDSLGNLSVLEFPFPAKRLYFFDKVPEATKRGFHAHKTLQQIFLVLQGSVTITCSTPMNEYRFELNSQDSNALLLPPGYWRILENFELETICLVMASETYDESDYIRDWNEYENWFIKNVSIHES
jgi:hypothetical protein